MISQLLGYDDINKIWNSGTGFWLGQLMLVSMNAHLTVTLEVSIELCVMTYSKVPL